MNERHKYPRTLHVPFSMGRSNDDKVLDNLDHFIGKEIVITEKMDGECTTLYPDYYSHARSLDSANHPSRDWIKSFHSEFAHEMLPGSRICGENLYAKHSIEYNDLESYFYGFSLWHSNTEGFDWCFCWDSTKYHFQDLGITLVPEIWRGTFDEKVVKALAAGIDDSTSEGFVIRTAIGFRYDVFDRHVAKYVRANHVHSDDHWMHQQITPNKLKEQK